MTAPADAAALIKRSIALAALLCALKTGAGLWTGSLSILASALDSLMDLCASAVNFVSLAIAREPADREHQYGHAKAEALASLFQGAFITLSGAALLVESLRRLFAGSSLEFHYWSVGIMLLSTILSAWHGAALRRAANAEESSIMAAEGAHFLMDVAANIAVVAALLLVRWTGAIYWDLGLTLVVVAYVLSLSAALVATAVRELMDEGLPPADRVEVETIILTHDPRVVGFHDFRSRKAGKRRYLEFHIEIRGVKEFEMAHEITEKLVEKIKERIPNSDVLIHYDPEGAR